ncbi:MAG: serine/threonine protein kinase [Pleurocapsa sp. SU_5_0]|nr:serine/threonine protein kinase [Pleurocapsa sp. SU_5_0]
MSLCINPECKKIHNSDTMIFCQQCGSELLLDGRYRVVQELGQGGFGTTYEILDLNSRPWVLKVLMDNHPKYVELFKQEAQVLALLNHPGIPKIDFDGYFLYYPEGKEEPLYCLVMEKIEGLNLSQYIKQRGDRPITPKRALRWLAELALLLEQVHNKNFFHRDIKPSNIMLRPNGCLALIDFGTAREVTQSYLQKMAAGEITGVITQGYTPMEQMRGKAVLQSDFYALGGTMIYLLTAQNPTKFYDLIKEKLIWHGTVPDIAPEFVNLIDRMMAFSPSKRPSSSREIFQAVIEIDSSLQILDEHFNAISSHSQAEKSLAHIVTTKTSLSSLSSSFNTQITPEFIERCRQELAEFIGPMANIICQRTIKQHPNMTKSELYLSLAQTISNPQQAKEFQQRFFNQL